MIIILSHFFDGLNYGESVGEPKTWWFAKEEKHQRVDSKAKRNKDDWGWRRLKQIGNDDFEKFSQFFKILKRSRSSFKCKSDLKHRDIALMYL